MLCRLFCIPGLIAPLIVCVLCSGNLLGQSPADANESKDVFIPRRQDKLPGPPRTPQEAIEQMSVPDGFSVELVASEPDLVNPVAMSIDDQGRFWVTESFEYPRREPGPGGDRIKVLEDTDQDGKVDKVTVFAEGLNIPSGIAVGYGGVWVANSPDILFMQDTDGDGKADHREVVVTGFGRTDTHELPNSLTWGPDGWLYGLNGVFNHSHIKYRGEEYRFTCAMFRIHPRTREFELFAEGTSNPWGIAFDPEGNAFVSACVIDHLWHLTETGYYHRQGGPYPPHTWKLPSIVNHKHQMAAYCGLTYFDSDAYPTRYRDKLYMGNIHGGCINVDRLTRNGATYLAKPEPDFLTANDVWFMPVVQKTGPDGCLYVLDWYDRYHCYQDANRDPKGIDRGHGRLYRVRYRQTPRARPFNLHEESDSKLIDRLASPNVFYRERAQRILAERNRAESKPVLESLVLNNETARKTRLHALWALIGSGPLRTDFHHQVIQHPDATLRAWAVRAAGNQGAEQLADPIVNRIAQLTSDPAVDVRLQVVIAARKLFGPQQAVDVLMRGLTESTTDPLIPHVVWQNAYPLIESHGNQVAAALANLNWPNEKSIEFVERALRRLVQSDDPGPHAAGQLLRELLSRSEWPSERLLTEMQQLVQEGLSREQRSALRQTLGPILADHGLRGIQIAALLGDSAAASELANQVAKYLASERPAHAIGLLQALVVAAPRKATGLAHDAFDRMNQADEQTWRALIDTVTQLSEPSIGELLLDYFTDAPINVRPLMANSLTQRTKWARLLLRRIQSEALPRDVLHVNQIRNLQNSPDEQIREQTFAIWGKVREGRNPEVEETIAEVKRLMRHQSGDPRRGRQVFSKTCAQCHQIFGEGQQVGPDITRNGRGSLDQLLSNIFDPNLVIGPAYQARIITTNDGRTLSGLLVEESAQRVVLKLQGGKTETIRRDEIDQLVVSPLSLMPEGWEKQLSDQELVDLLAFLQADVAN